MKLKDFVPASLEEIIKAKEFPSGVKGGSVGGSILVGSPGGLNSTIVYKVLEDTFGPMNTDFVDEKSTWRWVFKTDNGLLSVYDYKSGWSIGYVGTDRELKVRLKELANVLKDAILEEAKKIKISKKQIQESKLGGVVTNPYLLFRETSWELLEEAKKIISEIKKSKINENDIKNEFDDIKSKIDEINREINISHTVISLFSSAFIASYCSLEGFINIIYTIFLKKRYKNELFEKKLQNEMIITKLLEIDRYCNEFNEPVISVDEELFKAFQHLTNVRNDFIHANITKGMETHLVQVSPHQKLLLEERELKLERKYGICTYPWRITNVDIIRTQRLVEKIVIKIINGLNERTRIKFATVHSYYKIPYLYNNRGLLDFPLTEEDYIPDDEIEKILSLTPELDKEYYSVEEEEYVPKHLWI